MTELQQQILLLFSIPIYAILIPLEIILSNYRHRKYYSWKETAMNIYLNLVNAGIDLLLRGLHVLPRISGSYGPYNVPPKRASLRTEITAPNKLSGSTNGKISAKI